ncbi:MAG: hypothetical protein RMK97_01970 [Sutterellaceae bacterium]|nr:hypothetical protein [Burkholderiaceae bacterium]MCX7902693.1 hypothetical protein [Burkholderiaceae bacterium]MDW8429261.1 hypothetical protein [Sutterellaceae bacterium]
MRLLTQWLALRLTRFFIAGEAALRSQLMLRKARSCIAELLDAATQRRHFATAWNAQAP